jgi:hypothetical protein
MAARSLSVLVFSMVSRCRKWLSYCPAENSTDCHQGSRMNRTMSCHLFRPSFIIWAP